MDEDAAKFDQTLSRAEYAVAFRMLSDADLAHLDAILPHPADGDSWWLRDALTAEVARRKLSDANPSKR
jgi:hypothetical protein